MINIDDIKDNLILKDKALAFLFLTIEFRKSKEGKEKKENKGSKEGNEYTSDKIGLKLLKQNKIDAVILYNEDWFDSISEDLEVVTNYFRHEIYHFLLMHHVFPNRNLYDEKLFNITCDCIVGKFVEVGEYVSFKDVQEIAEHLGMNPLSEDLDISTSYYEIKEVLDKLNEQGNSGSEGKEEGDKEDEKGNGDGNESGKGKEKKQGQGDISEQVEKLSQYDSQESKDQHNWLDELIEELKEKGLTDEQIQTVLELTQAITEDMVKQITNNYGLNSELQKHLLSKLEKKVERVRWQDLLNENLTGSLRVGTKKSRARRHRFDIDEYQGSISQFAYFVGVALDTSGSVSNEDLKVFVQEWENIATNKNLLVKTILIQFDADITSIGYLEESSVIQRLRNEVTMTKLDKASDKINITGRGGTVYKGVFDFFSKHQNILTKLIVFTDGYAHLDYPEMNGLKNRILFVMPESNCNKDVLDKYNSIIMSETN